MQNFKHLRMLKSHLDDSAHNQSILYSVCIRVKEDSTASICLSIVSARQDIFVLPVGIEVQYFSYTRLSILCKQQFVCNVYMLVSVEVWLEWSILGNAKVGSLAFGQLGQVDTQVGQMSSSNFLIQLKPKNKQFTTNLQTVYNTNLHYYLTYQ